MFEHPITSPSSFEPPVRIEHTDGQPLPPLIENGVPWRVVRRANGRTLWRRLSLGFVAEMSS